MSKVVGLGTLADDISVSNGNANLSKMSLTPGSAPSNPVQGDMYLDSSDNNLKIYRGAAFINIVSDPASGGIVTTYSINGVNYQVHTFLTSQSFMMLENKSVDILLAAGGGGGGRYAANGVGGGGAGGMVVGNNISIVEGLYTITIGGGGIAYSTDSNGGKGGDSVIALGSVDTVTAKGGGAGYFSMASGHIDFADGGSAGGGGNNTTYNGASNQTNQTLNGQTLTGYGNGSAAPPNGGYGAGGGGAGGAGSSAATTPNAGGIGLVNNFRTGTNITYATGGGSQGSTFYNGLDNSGDGGTGANSGTAGRGGSGICVIRYQI
jgi:hypothetical protein